MVPSIIIVGETDIETCQRFEVRQTTPNSLTQMNDGQRDFLIVESRRTAVSMYLPFLLYKVLILQTSFESTRLQAQAPKSL
jgi:hypothetical protein